MTGTPSVTISTTSESAPAPVLTPEQTAAALATLKSGAPAQVNVQPQEKPKETPAPAGDRPAWLPEKFKSAEDLAKAYGELEKKLSSGQKPQEQKPAQTEQKPAEQTAEQKPEGQQQETKQPETADQVVDLLTKAGVKYDDLNAEFVKEGKLSDKSYESLAKAGFSKQLVDSWIAGQQAVAATLAAQVHAVVGGAEKYAEMVNWAKTALNDAEKAAFNAAVNGPVEQAKLAVQGLAARFSAAGGDEPNLLGGSTSVPGATGEGYRSRAEQVRAMNDPRYATDPAYRKEVEEKSMRSNF